jgi:hypothetical protein
MNNAIYEDDTVCILSVYNPARAYIPSCKTDVSRTFAEHSTADLMDDYEKTDSLDWLSNGRFKS